MTQHADQLSELIADYRTGIEDPIELLITLLDRLDEVSIVVIIGSGAGGGTVAHELTTRGVRCVVLEAGPHLHAKSIPRYAILAKKAQQANIAFPPLVLLGIMAALTVLAFVGLTVGTATSVPVRSVMAVVAGVGGVYFWVNSKAKKRIALMDEQLPDAVELMVRSLRVGHPFSSAIGIVSKEIPDPLGTEFGLISDEAAYGRDVAESLKAFAERMDSQDLRFLAVAVTMAVVVMGDKKPA